MQSDAKASAKVKVQSAPISEAVPAWFLMATIFITGNVVMMLEVVGTRVVGPFFGVGLYVWSALITVTLLALSAGYWVGGQWADRYHQSDYLFITIMGAGIFTWLIPVLRYPVLSMAGNLDMRVGVLLGSTLLFGPALFLLGIVSPYATKLFTRQFEKLGSRVGLLYAISTLGSFIGTLSMGFYLIPNFHISHILIGLGALLFLMPVIYFYGLRPVKTAPLGMPLLLVLAALVFIFQTLSPKFLPPNVKLMYKTTSFYGEIKVLDFGQERMLLVDGVTQSGVQRGSFQSTPPYIKDMTTLITRYRPQAKTVLVVGLGGGNVVHELLKLGCQVEVVEIDRKIRQVAETYFGIDPRQVKVTLEDGRRFVRTCPKKYDVVVLNTFNGETFPSHLLTLEFFREVKRILAPEGIVALNFVGFVQGPNRWASAAIYHTFRSAFSWCALYFHDVGYKFNNMVFVAGDANPVAAPSQNPGWEELRGFETTLQDWEQAVVCTDDFNPVEFLNRSVYRRWRKMVIENIGPDVLLN